MDSGLKRVGSFRELLVYQKSRLLALDIRLLGGMLEKSDQFCDNTSLTLREAPVEYIVSPSPSSDDEN